MSIIQIRKDPKTKKTLHDLFITKLINLNLLIFIIIVELNLSNLRNEYSK